MRETTPSSVDPSPSLLPPSSDFPPFLLTGSLSHGQVRRGGLRIALSINGMAAASAEWGPSEDPEDADEGLSHHFAIPGCLPSCPPHSRCSPSLSLALNPAHRLSLARSLLLALSLSTSVSPSSIPVHNASKLDPKPRP